jgi:putative FmdB family regulatory protein
MPRAPEVLGAPEPIQRERGSEPMPAYDFRCVDCATVCEVTRPARDDSPVSCPACGGATKQVFHPVGVHFKGSGFHNTDNRKAEPAVTAETPSCPDGGCAGCPAAE